MIDAVGNPQSLLVLGGTSDIALTTAKQYAQTRALRIVLADRPEESERLEAAAEELRKTGSTVSILHFDARKPETHAEVIEMGRIGAERLVILLRDLIPRLA